MFYLIPTDSSGMFVTTLAKGTKMFPYPVATLSPAREDARMFSTRAEAAAYARGAGYRGGEFRVVAGRLV